MYIPLRIRILHLFGRTSFIIGFLCGIIGLAFILYFSFQINWKMRFADHQDLLVNEAIITGWKEKHYEVNDQSLFEYHYSYLLDDEQSYSGAFLDYAGTYEVGQPIEIQYLKNAPEESRFIGKDRSNYHQIMFLAGLGCMIVALIFLYPSYRKTRRERRIIMRGLPTEAKLLHAEPTNLKINEQTVFKLTFEFLAGHNKPQKISVRSHLLQNLNGEEETLIYDPRRPMDAVVIRTLPSAVSKYILSKLDPAV